MLKTGYSLTMPVEVFPEREERPTGMGTAASAVALHADRVFMLKSPIVDIILHTTIHFKLMSNATNIHLQNAGSIGSGSRLSGF